MQVESAENLKGLSIKIDHTLLRPTATQSEIQKLISEGIEYNFATVCILPFYVPYAKKYLQDFYEKNSGSEFLKICTVVGFPLGANPTSAKVEETKWCVQMGADEIDMVLCLPAFKNCDMDSVRKDISEVRNAAKDRVLKVIIETVFLNEEEKFLACSISEECGADFVKTCTGFNGGAASVEDISLMRKSVSPRVKVKASGGIRSYAQALELIHAGADRLGTSSGIAILQNLKGSMGNY